MGTMLTTLAVANYRSLRELIVPLGSLNMVSGENGSGKSNLHRSLRLLADVAHGGVVASLAREGGLASTLWAGPEAFGRAVKAGDHPVQGVRRDKSVNLRRGFASDRLGYSVDLGLPIPSKSAFSHDPEIKRECIWAGEYFRPASVLVDRRGSVVRSRKSRGDWKVLTSDLPSFDSMLTEVADPENAPEIIGMRDYIRSWRFYDHFRTDAEAPARQVQLGTRTVALDNDGRDLAAALQTILEIGDSEAVGEAISGAFPGSSLVIAVDSGRRFAVGLHQDGLLRPLASAELSDGTLRYLLWVAALLTPRPPELMVLNEPETSLHPDLLPALAHLIRRAAERTQIWVVSHSALLIALLAADKKCESIVLTKEFGETRIQGQARLEMPSWHWPER
jgi:predicted ATPase